MKKILCPVDFSEVSINAIEFAANLADAHHSSLVLMNVFTEEDFNKILDSESINKEYNDKLILAENQLKQLADEIVKSEKKKGLLGCSYELRSGKLDETILDYVKEEEIDLIVMGSTGITDLTEKYIGSKTLKIIEDTGCSVLVVPEGQSYHKIKRIVYATDYQEEDKLAIQQVVSLATVLKAHIDVLHVSHSENDISLAVYEEFKEEIKSFTHFKDIKFYREVFSSTTKGLKEFMSKNQADLLVLLNKKRNFFQNLFHQSVTKELYEFSDFPFLVLKNT